MNTTIATYPPPVLTKRDMYDRADRGEFGNVLPRWYDVPSWYGAIQEKQSVSRDALLWGVRHRTVANFPGTRLNVPTAEVVPAICRAGMGEGEYVISPMVGHFGSVQWEGDIMRRHDGPGLLASGNVSPAPGSWRTHMKSPRRWEGSAASVLLRRVLNDNSYDDVMMLLDLYPDHVVELSALDVCYGTVPGRNAVIWEVRRY